MPRINLTFDALPTFVSTPTFFSLDEDVDRRLRTLEGVYARCNAALRFNSWIDAGKDLIHLRDEERAPMSVAFLRAALMEFAGMEEALATDLHRDAVPLRIRDTRNAMLVVLRELRNVQVHLVRTSLVTGTRLAVQYYKGEEYRHDLTASTIPIEDLERLKDSRNAAYCERADFFRAVEWLAGAQEHWGISDVVMYGIWEYARAIVEAHVPAA